MVRLNLKWQWIRFAERHNLYSGPPFPPLRCIMQIFVALVGPASTDVVRCEERHSVAALSWLTLPARFHPLASAYLPLLSLISHNFEIVISTSLLTDISLI